MRTSVRATIATTAALAGAAVVGGALFLYSGAYDVGADAPHWPVTYRILDEARVRSIKAHADGIAAPADLGSQARVVAGTAHFAAHCAVCHSAPGVDAEDMADGMYPKPPVLTHVSDRYTPGELFWILKNGIKMSGMPSWGDHGDDQLWNAVAFLEKLPGMTPEQYGALVKEAEAAGGHDMGKGQGGMSMSGMDMPGHGADPGVRHP